MVVPVSPQANPQLISGLRHLSEAVFARSAEEWANDVHVINHALRLKPGAPAAYVDWIRPKFFTGDPAAIRAQAYLLVISLNYKYEAESERHPTARAVHEEYAKLNRNATDHYSACANHFSPHRTAHPFFFRFSPILAAFTGKAHLRDKPSQQALLRAYSFFMEAIPLFSSQTNTIPIVPDSVNATAVLRQNYAAFRLVLEQAPPAAILLNGAASFGALRAISDLRPVADFARKELSSTTRAQGGGVRKCWYEQALFLTRANRSIPAFRCNFVKTIDGPNSVDQRRELGALIREACNP